MIIAIALVSAILTKPIAVDGDTLHDNRWNRDYRIHGIDTPETERAKCDAEKALGERAKARVSELLAAAGEVKAIAAWEPRTRARWPMDGFGRRLARIEIDGVDLGGILLAEGLALPYDGEEHPDWCVPAADS